MSMSHLCLSHMFQVSFFQSILLILFWYFILILLYQLYLVLHLWLSLLLSVSLALAWSFPFISAFVCFICLFRPVCFYLFPLNVWIMCYLNVLSSLPWTCRTFCSLKFPLKHASFNNSKIKEVQLYWKYEKKNTNNFYPINFPIIPFSFPLSLSFYFCLYWFSKSCLVGSKYMHHEHI